jgi:hypothetical protein
MANTPLTGNTISSSYQGLLKAGDSGAIGATEKIITDGLANASTLSLGTSSASFTGTLDLSGATVTGLPAAAAGLVSGTGTDSMKNADSLVTTPAVALGLCAIALGDAACAKTNNDIAIGTGAVTSNGNSISIGCGACNGNSDCSIVIGKNAQVNGWSRLIAIGANSCHVGNGYGGAAIGCSACAYGPGVSIGNQAKAAAFISGVSIGDRTCVTANGAVALGTQVVAATADTVSVKALETQTASTPTAGGIIMTDAGSTARRLNIDASGNLQIDSTPVGGGGGAAGLESGTGTDSMQSAASLTTVAADAAASCSIAIGNGAITSGTLGGNIAIGDNARSVGTTNNAGIAIGKNSCVGSYDGIAIGLNATTPTNGQVFGAGSCVCDNQGVALGFSAFANGGASALGHQAKACGSDSLAVHQACALGTRSIAIGENACSVQANAIAIGCGAIAQYGIAIGTGVTTYAAGQTVSIGHLSDATANETTALGYSAQATGNRSTAIGSSAVANAAGAVALGRSVTASRDNTVTGCQLEACVAGKGIVVTSPDGLTTLGIGIDNTGAIVTYTP